MKIIFYLLLIQTQLCGIRTTEGLCEVDIVIVIIVIC